MLGKALVSLFLTLLIIIFIEVGFLFIPKTSQNKQQTVSATPTLGPRPLRVGEEDRAINTNALKSLLLIRKTTVKSLLAKIEIEGNIEKLITDPGINNGFSYEKGVIINTGKTPSYLYFSKEDIKKLDIKSGETKIPWEELKVGDRVTIQTVQDLTKNPSVNSVSIVITKI